MMSIAVTDQDDVLAIVLGRLAEQAGRARGDARASSPSLGRAVAAGTDISLDPLLLAVAERRDREAFARLFRAVAPRIKAYLMRQGCDAAGAEELMQEVMVTVWRRSDSFDPAKANASTWLFTIARNKRIDQLRRERRPELEPDDPALVPEPTQPADRAVETAQDAERLRGAIAALPAEQRDLVLRAFYDDKPHSLIAAESKLPLGTVKSRLRLALARLRREVGDE